MSARGEEHLVSIASASSDPQPTVCLTVDAEPDCPPFLWSWRGMTEGAPALLDLLSAEGVPATFFTTGEAARCHPKVVEDIVACGHELASHGMSHRAFPSLSPEEALTEIREASGILRSFGAVTAFRAPYLRMPSGYLPYLEDDGYRVDSSVASYKTVPWRARVNTGLVRLPASMTSSWLRLPPWLRDPVLRRLASPVVLFVHPWEFVDVRRADIPWDCRAGTGVQALDALRGVIQLYKSAGVRFLRIDEVASESRKPS
jgi:peptidoglycan/xylan/chitin deacetylase (PgdA/CDA1 family)